MDEPAADPAGAAEEPEHQAHVGAVDGGHLFVVHEVDRRGATLRYLHRFLMLDESLAMTAVSQPFTFTSDRVEFCAGMARRDDELVLSFGVSDAAAGLGLVSIADALALLEPWEQRSAALAGERLG